MAGHQCFVTIVSFICYILTFPIAVFSNGSGNVSLPHNDSLRPGCRRIIAWKKNAMLTDFTTTAVSCGSDYAGSDIIHLDWLYDFAALIKKDKTINDGEEIDFFTKANAARGQCGMTKMEFFGGDGVSHKAKLTFISGKYGLSYDSKKAMRITHSVCARLWCPPATTTSTTTTTAPTTAVADPEVTSVRLGLLGLTTDNEILIYRIAICVLLVLLLFFIVLLVFTCTRLRRAKDQQIMAEGRSHVSIRRVTESLVDPYSSMAGIAETSSLGGPEVYGSIARRKEFNRLREKAWLREHGYAGSHMGMPPCEDMNGLLPVHGGVHRASISSLTQGGSVPGGHNGSLSRVAGIRGSTAGTYPTRPAVCQLSRQNTGDSMHYRTHVAPQSGPHQPEMSVVSSPGVSGSNGHANPLNDHEEMEGHMV